jgi:hypothetical protein
MQELTVTEMKEASGGGTRIGTTSSGGSNGGLHVADGTEAAPLGGRIDPGGANSGF